MNIVEPGSNKRTRPRSGSGEASPTRRPFWSTTPRANQRLEPALYALIGQPCSFTIRTYRQCSPFRDDRFASIAQRCLLDGGKRYECLLDAYCIMPDHVHVIATPLSGGASSLEFLARFKGLTSYQMGKAGWHGQVWQPGFYDHLIRRDEDLVAIVAYVMENPVRKGLCDDPAAYPWSGMQELADAQLGPVT